MDGAAALTVLDAAYADAIDDATWLAGVTAAVAPALDRGLGVAGYFVELGGPGEFRGWGHTGDTDIDVPAMWQLVSARGPDFLRQVHMTGPFGTTEGLVRLGIRGGGAVLSAMDVGGAAGVMGIDPSGRGVAFGTWRPSGTPAPARRGEAEFWARVAPHLATAARLRRLLQVTPAEAEAVLEPSGRLVHAEPAAAGRIEREALRQAVVQFDRARGRGRKDDAAVALSLWRCMVEKRWTLVDRFERDGRRYLVAYPNAPDARHRLPSLSARERTVAAAAALGHSNKVVAYELDLAVSTVATMLSRAMKKLGVASRLELVRVFRSAEQEST